MTKKFDVYAMVTEKILAMLEKGVVPWHKPWDSSIGAPQNLFSKTVYRGINTLLLAALGDEKGYTSPYWLTFKQLSKWGGRVVKGEHATQVVFWKEIKTTEKVEMENLDTGEMEMVDHESSRWIIRYYSVFNTEQTEGIEERIPKIETVEHANGVIPRCEAIVEGFIDAPPVTQGGNRAFYNCLADSIRTPPIEAFDNSEGYYSTLFHELIHSTGHKTRLGRFDGKVAGDIFGSDSYSKEELVAEMGACFIASMTGIDEETRENSAAYIKGWMKKIKGDKRLVVSAAGLAQKAVDHMTRGGDSPSPLIKGDIVGKCHVCSEPWDQADVDDADQTMVCPYCRTNLAEHAVVMPDGGEPDKPNNGFPSRCFSGHYGTVHCERCDTGFRAVCRKVARDMVLKFIEDEEIDWVRYINAMETRGFIKGRAEVIMEEIMWDGFMVEIRLGHFEVVPGKL